MNIKFSDYFNKEVKNQLSLTIHSIRDTIENPTDHQTVEVNGLKLKLFTKEIDNLLLLVLSKVDGDTITVDTAFKIKKDLKEGITLRKPLSILQAVIENFGLNIEVGSYQGKFLFNEVIPIVPNSHNQLVNIINPTNAPFVQQLYFKMNDKQVECALAYALNTEEYLKWINT